MPTSGRVILAVPIFDYIHTQDEVVCVLSGTADVKVADEHGSIESGDRVDVPANTYHSITVTSTEPLVVLTGMRKFLILPESWFTQHLK